MLNIKKKVDHVAKHLITWRQIKFFIAPIKKVIFFIKKKVNS
jgi:hypothetical protein